MFLEKKFIGILGLCLLLGSWLSLRNNHRRTTDDTHRGTKPNEKNDIASDWVAGGMGGRRGLRGMGHIMNELEPQRSSNESKFEQSLSAGLRAQRVSAKNFPSCARKEPPERLRPRMRQARKHCDRKSGLPWKAFTTEMEAILTAEQKAKLEQLKGAQSENGERKQKRQQRLKERQNQSTCSSF